jgi:hypothetical protein
MRPDVEQFVATATEKLRRLDPEGTHVDHQITGFQAARNAAGGARVTFVVKALKNVHSVALLRNISKDPGSAKIISTWPEEVLEPTAGNVLYVDADSTLAQFDVYYWLRVFPRSYQARSAFKNTPILHGPVKLGRQDNDFTPTAQLLSADIALGADFGTTQEVFITVDPPNDPRYESFKVYVTNYHGSNAMVAVAQSISRSARFRLDKGDVLTFTFVPVSIRGIENLVGAIVRPGIAINGTRSPLPHPAGLTVAALTTGVQLSWYNVPTDLVSPNIAYKIYRGALGAGFGAAAAIATGIAPASGAITTYLDTVGIYGAFEWYVTTVTFEGESSNSLAASVVQINSSTALAPNTNTNSTNGAVVDSIDAGASATIRIYGFSGGVGSTWTRFTGGGLPPTNVQTTFPAGSITGLSYNTDYFVVYDRSTGTYRAITNVFATVLDAYVFAGKVHTVAGGGGGGVSGGGSSGGSFGGGHLLRVG